MACKLPNQQDDNFLIINIIYPLFENKYFQKKYMNFFNYERFLFMNRMTSVSNVFSAILNIKVVKKHLYDLTKLELKNREIDKPFLNTLYSEKVFITR